MDLPERVFPERSNPQRLRGLYGDSVDDDVLDFWKRLLTAYCRHSGRLVLDTDAAALERYFTVQGVVPLSLRRSFSLLRHSDFVFPQSFSRSKPYNYVLNSLVDSVHPLLSYVLPLNSLVCLPLLQEIEALVVKATARLSAMQRLLYLDENRQPSLQSFIQQLAHSLSAPSSSSASSDSFDRDSELRHMLAHFTSSDTLILADYMRSRGSIAVDRSEGIARLVGHTQPASLWYSWSSPEGSVSEADVAKWKLANTMGKLRDLDAAYTARIAAVAAALRVNIKSKADQRLLLSQLKIKKTLEAAQSRLQTTLLSLLAVEESLTIAEMNVEVTEAYRASAVGLKSIREQLGDAEQALDAFQEEAQQVDEVRELLSSDATSGFDEDLLADEFEGLLLEVSREEGVELGGAAGRAATATEAGAARPAGPAKPEPSVESAPHASESRIEQRAAPLL